MRSPGTTNLHGKNGEPDEPQSKTNRMRMPHRNSKQVMSSADNGAPRAAQTDGAIPQNCLICRDPIGDRCFCKIHRKEDSPILLCCPSCVIQYIDSARPPADTTEKELRDYEKNCHFFIGDNKPWS
jgi:hypothetical protein